MRDWDSWPGCYFWGLCTNFCQILVLCSINSCNSWSLCTGVVLLSTPVLFVEFRYSFHTFFFIFSSHFSSYFPHIYALFWQIYDFFCRIYTLPLKNLKSLPCLSQNLSCTPGIISKSWKSYFPLDQWETQIHVGMKFVKRFTRLAFRAKHLTPKNHYDATFHIIR